MHFLMNIFFPYCHFNLQDVKQWGKNHQKLESSVLLLV